MNDLRATLMALETFTPAGGWRRPGARPVTVDRDAVLALLAATPEPTLAAFLDAVRAYGDARADVAYGRATRKAIDLAWERLLAVGRIPPMDTRTEPVPGDDDGRHTIRHSHGSGLHDHKLAAAPKEEPR